MVFEMLVYYQQQIVKLELALDPSIEQLELK